MDYSHRPRLSTTATSGRDRGKQRLEGIGNIYASLVGAAGRVYLIDRDGNAVVFRHGKKFELLAQNKLDDGFDASPVSVGKGLYLRGYRSPHKVAGQ